MFIFYILLKTLIFIMESDHKIKGLSLFKNRKKKRRNHDNKYIIEKESVPSKQYTINL